MVRLLVRIVLLLFALNQLLSPCEAFGSYGGKGGYNSGKYGDKSSKSYEDPMRSQAFSSSSADISGQSTGARRGLGISAWGLVVLIIALILAGMGFYYFSLCYPILCKKERNYDIIQPDHV